MSKVSALLSSFLLLACSKGGPAQQTAVPKPEATAPVAPAPVAEAKPPAPPPEGDEVPITSTSPEAVEHFKKGRDLVENQRGAEAAAHFKEALKLDANFAQATLYLGQVTPGSEGLALIDHAAELAKPLPESERTFIEASQLGAKGEGARRDDLMHKLAAAKPRDARLQLIASQIDFGNEKWPEAVAEAQHALEINPKYALALNYVAYGLAWQGKYDEAIAAAQKQVEGLPDEPNPLDSLAEIQLVANKLNDALASFDKATAKSAAFTGAHVGAAVVLFYKGDSKGAMARLHKAGDAAPRAFDTLQVGYAMGWLLAAQGKTADMLKVYDAMAKKAADEKLDIPAANLAANRAYMLALLGKNKDALAQADKSLADAKAANLPPQVLRGLSLLTAGTRLVVAKNSKDKAGAAKAAADIEEQEKGHDTAFDRSTLAYAHGMLAWTNGDAKGAVAAFQQCSLFDDACRFSLVGAQRAAGDKAGAKATLAKLKASPHRDPSFAFFWATTK